MRRARLLFGIAVAVPAGGFSGAYRFWYIG